MKRKRLYFSSAPAIRFSPLCLLFPTRDILEVPISFPVIFQPKYSLTGELRLSFSSPRVCSGGVHSGSGLRPPPSWGWAPCPHSLPLHPLPVLALSEEQGLVKGAHFEKCKPFKKVSPRRQRQDLLSLATRGLWVPGLAYF